MFMIPITQVWMPNRPELILGERRVKKERGCRRVVLRPSPNPVLGEMGAVDLPLTWICQTAPRATYAYGVGRREINDLTDENPGRVCTGPRKLRRQELGGTRGWAASARGSRRLRRQGRVTESAWREDLVWVMNIADGDSEARHRRETRG